MEGIFFSVLEVTSEVNAASAPALKETMDKEWARMKPALSEQFSQFMVMGAHYSYRNVSDEDLTAYIKFLKSPNGQSYWRAGVDIIDLYMTNFVSKLAKRLTPIKGS